MYEVFSHYLGVVIQVLLIWEKLEKLMTLRAVVVVLNRFKFHDEEMGGNTDYFILLYSLLYN